MATTLQDFGGAPALPLSAALEIIPSLPRQLLSRLVARAIERLDEMDGDTDIEPDHSEDDALPPPIAERAQAAPSAILTMAVRSWASRRMECEPSRSLNHSRRTMGSARGSHELV
jgi:hypothetical protein